MPYDKELYKDDDAKATSILKEGYAHVAQITMRLTGATKTHLDTDGAPAQKHVLADAARFSPTCAQLAHQLPLLWLRALQHLRMLEIADVA